MLRRRRRRRGDEAVVQSAQDMEGRLRRRRDDARQREDDVHDRGVLAQPQIRLQDPRRRRRGHGGRRAEADVVRDCAGRGRAGADGGVGDGSSARPGLGGCVWPYEPPLVMGGIATVDQENRIGGLLFVGFFLENSLILSGCTVYVHFW